MKGGTKAALALLALWGLSGSSSRAKGAAKSPPLSPKKGERGERREQPRPEEAKPEPGPAVRLDPQDPDDEAPATPPGGGKKKPASPNSEATPPSSAPGTPPGDKKRKKRPAVEDRAAELAESMEGMYLSRGIESPIAATEALTIYFLAGGADPKIIKGYQSKMGVDPSGGYDKETSNMVAKELDMAIDGAINSILQQEFGGEQPAKAAGLALLQYLDEARDITAAVPREKIAALQIAMGSASSNGRYDEDTKNRLVELGITPVDHVINENQMVVE